MRRKGERKELSFLAPPFAVSLGPLPGLHRALRAGCRLEPGVIKHIFARAGPERGRVPRRAHVVVVSIVRAAAPAGDALAPNRCVAAGGRSCLLVVQIAAHQQLSLSTRGHTTAAAHSPLYHARTSTHTTQTFQNKHKKTGGIFFIISVVGAAAILLSLLTLCCFCCVKRPGSARRKAKKGSQFVEGDAAAAGAYGATPTAYDTAVPIGGTGVGARDAYAVGTTDTAIRPTHGTAMV